MKKLSIKILRGSDQIGGTCIRISTDTTSVLLDAGLPLSDKSALLTKDELKADAIFISHPHQDHFGLIEHVTNDTPVYIGEVGRKLIEATKVFINKPKLDLNFYELSDKYPAVIGDIKVTAIPMDHSAVDSYSLLIEACGKRILYSGDFRGHGRKDRLFQNFLADPPENVDILLMEGTMMQRSNREFPSESSVEEKIVEALNDQEGISFLVSSSQTIDRIVSAYRACLRTDKTLILDFYTAWVLEIAQQLSKRIPQMAWEKIKIYADYFQNDRLQQNREYFGDFIDRAYRQRIRMNEVQNNPNAYLWLTKTSQYNKIERFRKLCGVNIIYSQWIGYIDEENAETRGEQKFSQYRNVDDINFTYAHTSGHAPVADLQLYANAVKPNLIIPLHTEFPSEYSKHFNNVKTLEDGQKLDLSYG